MVLPIFPSYLPNRTARALTMSSLVLRSRLDIGTDAEKRMMSRRSKTLQVWPPPLGSLVSSLRSLPRSSAYSMEELKASRVQNGTTPSRRSAPHSGDAAAPGEGTVAGLHSTGREGMSAAAAAAA